MMHKEVQRELYGRRAKRGNASGRFGGVTISRRQVIVWLLMMIILGCWALDSFKVSIIPQSMHQRVANAINDTYYFGPVSSVVPAIDATVAHNPLDDSPITFGSVILLGIVCFIGLVGLAVTTTQQKAN